MCKLYFDGSQVLFLCWGLNSMLETWLEAQNTPSSPVPEAFHCLGSKVSISEECRPQHDETNEQLFLPRSSQTPSLPPSLPPTHPPPLLLPWSPLIMLLKWRVAVESAALVLYITVKSATRVQCILVQYQYQWEDHARLSAAAAAAAAMAAIYCNYLNPLMELATAEHL